MGIEPLQGDRLLVCLPWMIAGSWTLGRTDSALEALASPSFTEAGQQGLERMLREQGVQQLWAADYDLYGMLEVRLPDLGVRHVWGDASRRFGERDAALKDLLRAARGEHLLIVKPTARRIYDLSPSHQDLQELAESMALEVALVEALESEKAGRWASLYTVR